MQAPTTTGPLKSSPSPRLRVYLLIVVGLGVLVNAFSALNNLHGRIYLTVDADGRLAVRQMSEALGMLLNVLLYGELALRAFLFQALYQHKANRVRHLVSAVVLLYVASILWVGASAM
ncbi:MAG: hypothetical protein SGCHY_005250, partial [Lobulomycetales sp.]